MIAVRALNQSIGRLIRGKNDFGSIFIIDKRMEEAGLKQNIVDWVRKEVKVLDHHKMAVPYLHKMYSHYKKELEVIQLN